MNRSQRLSLLADGEHLTTARILMFLLLVSRLLCLWILLLLIFLHGLAIAIVVRFLVQEALVHRLMPQFSTSGDDFGCDVCPSLHLNRRNASQLQASGTTARLAREPSPGFGAN